MAIHNGRHPQTESGSRCVGFVGPSAVGKTTVATLLADRLQERSTVRIHGEAATFVDDTHQDGLLGIEWTVRDCPAGTEAVAASADEFDTVFIVATPATLGRVSAYEQVAAEHGVDCLLVVNRFTEAARDQLRAFEGPALAEYVYENETIPTAIEQGNPPTLEEWTVEAMLIEALQPERTDEESAVEALATGSQQIVNVEVAERSRGDSLVAAFEATGHHAAYLRCNCRCHDGHVLARQQPAADPRQAAHSLEGRR